MSKTTVKLGGVALAASAAITWRLTTGVSPYTTAMSVHESDWPQLKDRRGKPLKLVFKDSRGETLTIEEVYVLHRLPSTAPNLITFLVADRRWKWSYKLIARDYNVMRRTGDLTALNTVPIENLITVDQYRYRKASLQGTKAWTAIEALKDVLKLLVGEGDFRIASFPLKESSQGGGAASEDGQISVQNLILRDQGDAALARVLSQIPGAEVCIDFDGKVAVFDGTDIAESEKLATKLPPLTWEGDKVEFIAKGAIRPSAINVHYQREVEALFSFSDDYGNTTTAQLGSNEPFIENVVQTTDPLTKIIELDPETQNVSTKEVPAGTWVEVKQYLFSMDVQKPSGSLPWDFETISQHWVIGDLESVLGGRDLDLDKTATVMLRIQSLKANFRRTFRVNRKYMDRVRDFQPVRVGVLDPVTGTRAPAAAWAQACIIPSEKGKMVSRVGKEFAGLYINIDKVSPGATLGKDINELEVSPARVVVIDKDCGVFRIDWTLSPAGIDAAALPCCLDNVGGGRDVPWGDLAEQDRRAIVVSAQMEGVANGLLLSAKSYAKAMVTIIPGAPNSPRQFLKRTIKPSQVSEKYRKEFGIKDGKGPELDIFVSPTELTARYAVQKQDEAAQGIQKLLGLDSEDPDAAGIDGDQIPGYVLCNGEKELKDHALGVAAEAYAAFADARMGNAVTRFPKTNGRLALVGNLGSIGFTVSAAPSAKCWAVHEFSGQQRSINRMALMPASVRNLIYGILPAGTPPAS